MPKQINTAGVGQRLVQLFSLKGRFQPVLDEVIVPVVSVDPEEVQQRPASAYRTQAAVAGEYSYFCLFNPSNSGILLRPTRTIVQSSTGVNVYLTMGFLARTNAMVKAWTDQRLPGSPQADVGTGTTAVSIAGSSILTWIAGSSSNEPMGIDLFDMVIEPGNGLLVALGTVNLAGVCSVQWTESPIVSDGYN